MENTRLKESRLNIRCDVHARELLDKAATYAHVSVSEFVLTHALANENITLKPKDFHAFLALLDTQAKANPALKKAFKRHTKQVSR